MIHKNKNKRQECTTKIQDTYRDHEKRPSEYVTGRGEGTRRFIHIHKMYVQPIAAAPRTPPNPNLWQLTGSVFGDHLRFDFRRYGRLAVAVSPLDGRLSHRLRGSKGIALSWRRIDDRVLDYRGRSDVLSSGGGGGILGGGVDSRRSGEPFE